MAKHNEFENFTTLMKSLVNVPHEDVKAALDKEKKQKPKKPSASKLRRDTKPKGKQR